MSFDSNVNGQQLSEIVNLEPVSIQIPVHNGPISDIAVSADGSHLLVANYGDGTVSVIDTDHYRVVQTISGVDEPSAIAVGPSGETYVSSVTAAYDAVQVVDMGIGAVAATHPIALSVSGLAAGADGKRLYLTRNGARNADLAIMDTATGHLQVMDIPGVVGTTTECIRVNADGSRVYVGVNGPAGGQVVVVDTGVVSEPTGRRARRRHTGTNGAPAVLEAIDVGLAVRDLALSPSGALLYVVSSGPEFAVLDVVDTRTNQISATRKLAEVNGNLTRLAISGDGDRAYLVGEDSVTVLCMLTHDVINSLNAATQPSCVAESRDGRYLYVADYTGTVIVSPIEQSGVEQAALESGQSADLLVPELLQYDAALV